MSRKKKRPQWVVVCRLAVWAEWIIKGCGLQNLQKNWLGWIMVGVLVVLLIVAKSHFEAIKISDEKLDAYGEALANWGNVHHTSFTIGGVAVHHLVNAKAGWDSVSYGADRATHRPSLRQLIGEATCSLEELGNKFAQLASINTTEDLAATFFCLGPFQFQGLAFSPE